MTTSPQSLADLCLETALYHAIQHGESALEHWKLLPKELRDRMVRKQQAKFLLTDDIQILGVTSQLETVNLRSCIYASSGLLKVIESTVVTTIILEHCRYLTDSAVGRLIKHCASIISVLSIVHCDLLTPNSLFGIWACTELMLTLGQRLVTIISKATPGRRLPTLQSLCLVGNSAQSVAVNIKLLEVLFPNLCELRVHKCAINALRQLHTLRHLTSVSMTSSIPADTLCSFSREDLVGVTKLGTLHLATLPQLPTELLSSLRHAHILIEQTAINVSVAPSNLETLAVTIDISKNFRGIVRSCILQTVEQLIHQNTHLQKFSLFIYAMRQPVRSIRLRAFHNEGLRLGRWVLPDAHTEGSGAAGAASIVVSGHALAVSGTSVIELDLMEPLRDSNNVNMTVIHKVVLETPRLQRLAFTSSNGANHAFVITTGELDAPLLELKKLELAYVRLSASKVRGGETYTTWKGLRKILQLCPALAELELIGVRLTDAAVEIIHQCSPHLKRLRIANAAELCMPLFAFRKLHSLVIQSCPALEGLRLQCPLLVELELTDCRCTRPLPSKERSGEAVATAELTQIQDILKGAPSLRRIVVDGLGSQVVGAVELDLLHLVELAVRRCPEIEVLTLRCPKLRFLQLYELPSLCKVDLTLCKLLRKKHLEIANVPSVQVLHS